MRSPFTILICIVFFASSSYSINHKINVPKKVISFKENPKFYQTIRGLKYDIPKPDRKNIQAAINSFDPVYQDYIRNLLKGFISELSGDYMQAQKDYEKCILTPVHDEQSYYTHLDLARISLKLDLFHEAKQHLKIYLSSMGQEISAGEGNLTQMFFGHTPSGNALEEMKAHYKNIKAVYDQLEKAF